MTESLTYSATWTLISVQNGLSAVTNFGAACQPGGSFLGLPTWYKYLDGETSGAECNVRIDGVNDLWLVVIALIEIMIRVAVLVAIGYIIYGGIKYILARGNPEKITEARVTIQDALIGLAIAIVAVALVNFIGNRF